MRPHIFFGLLVMWVVVAFPCLGQTSPTGMIQPRGGFSISGKVHNATDEQGIDDVRVNLTLGGTPVAPPAYTANGGNFQFDGLSTGDYVIEVRLNGYEPFRETVSISRGPVIGVSVALTRPLSVPNKKSGEAISVHQLSVPQNAQDAFEKGMDVMRLKGDYEGALVQFQQAIKLFPNYYEAYAMEGVAYISLHDPSSAESALRKSIELSSSRYPDAFFLLAGLLNSAGRFPEAETAARSAVALDISYWAGHFELAHALYLLRRSEEAEPEAIRAHELNPLNPKIVLLLADIHRRRRNYPALLQDMDTYLKLDPTGPDADKVRRDRDQVLQAIQKVPEQPPAEHFEQ